MQHSEIVSPMSGFTGRTGALEEADSAISNGIVGYSSIATAIIRWSQLMCKAQLVTRQGPLRKQADSDPEWAAVMMSEEKLSSLSSHISLGCPASG